MLTISSLLSILLFMFHLTDDIVRGLEKGDVWNLTAVPIFVVWLYGTVLLAGRRSGYIIMILGSILSMGALILHTEGNGLLGGRIANTSGVFFWTWTLLSLGVTGLFSLILSVQGLWRLRGQSHKSTKPTTVATS
jgi:hypothetical protein